MFSMLRALQTRLDDAEAQRRKDAEQAEAQRKKVKALQSRLDDTEAQRKIDAEKAEVQRKKDAEKAEVQRRKDQADAREQSRKLITNIEELEYKIKCLEQQAVERDLERKQKDEATQRYIESLAGDIEATTDFLAVGVTISLLSTPTFPLLLTFLYSRTRPDSIKSNAETYSIVLKPCSPHTSGWWTAAPTLPPCPSGRLSVLLPLSTNDNNAFLIFLGRRETNYLVKPHF